MIEAKKLRIGNWVEVDGKYRQVLAVDSIHSYLQDKGSIRYFVDESYGDAGRWLSKINPIPLTPELLEKCAGIHKTKSGYGLKIPSGQIIFLESHEDGSFWSSLFQYGRGQALPKQIHLHQLQNLFFCLAGTELEVTF